MSNNNMLPANHAANDKSSGRRIISRVASLPRIWNYVLITLLAATVLNLTTRTESKTDNLTATHPDDELTLSEFVAVNSISTAHYKRVYRSSMADGNLDDGHVHAKEGLLLTVSGLELSAKSVALSGAGRHHGYNGAITANLTVQTRIVDGLNHGEDVHIAVRLLNAEDGFLLWSENYQGSTDEMDKLCGQIREALWEGMNVELPTTAEGNAI